MSDAAPQPGPGDPAGVASGPSTAPLDPFAGVEPPGGWASASLRIASETLGRDAISDLLGLRSTTSRTSEGEPSFTVWVLESGLEPAASVADHLYILVERLRDRADAVRTICETATVEVWLSFSPGATNATSVLDHGLLAELGALGVDLVLEPYAPVVRRAERPV